MTRAFLATTAVAALLAGPAVFAAEPAPPPQPQLAQARVAGATERAPHYEWQYMYDRHQNYAPHWVLVR